MNTVTEYRELECRSSAVTLSDMEIFVFPELLYGLVLANIMSPRIWAWKNDPWFAGMEQMKPYRRITRIKQFIMEHYIFNLDLDTWGLTTKEREMGRFSAFLEIDALRKSNALFGYEGDKYYFDLDIRTHFGLDRYNGNVIPYWKTETVEAMDAFRHKPGYQTGAGECVSLSTLYAAALFVIGGIPLKDIFLMATPLHSQNFVDVDDGILTNNRRLVTKNMWFNGTELSGQARRALEKENVTVVSHESGTIHTVFDDATIDLNEYQRFSRKLQGFLKAKFSQDLFGNFLRQAGQIQKCFQIRWPEHGVDHYIGAERVFAYEHNSSYMVTGSTRAKLMAEIEKEEFQHHPLQDRLVLNDLEDYIRRERLDLDKPADMDKLKSQFCGQCTHKDQVAAAISGFCSVRPHLPDAATKRFKPETEPLAIAPEMGREEIESRLDSIRGSNRSAQMAFYASRDLLRTEPDPFIKAAVERNPVCLAETAGLDIGEIERRIRAMPDESIYDGPGRLAQPDEVWNYGRGDGIEKAVAFADILYHRQPDRPITLDIDGKDVVLSGKGLEYRFSTGKQLAPGRWKIENLNTPEVRKLDEKIAVSVRGREEGL